MGAFGPLSFSGDPMPRKKDNGRRHIPMPTGEMLVLMALYEKNKGLTVNQISKKIGRKVACLYTLLQRLKARKFIHNETVWLKGKDGKKHRFSLVQLTRPGLTLAMQWNMFLRQIGGETRKAIGWRLAW
jgi:hypothetical protein